MPRCRQALQRGAWAVSLVLGFAFTAMAEPPPQLEPRVLLLRLNDQELGDVLLLQGSDGTVYARDVDFDAWRVRRPAVEPLEFSGEAYLPLTSASEGVIEVDLVRQTLDLQLPAASFEPTQMGNQGSRANALTPSANGAALNYEWFASSSRSPIATQTQLSGLLDLMTFNRRGTGSSGLLLDRVFDSSSGEAPSSYPRAIRLDSSWILDDAERAQRLEVGDALSGSGIWGRPVRFGGVRWGRDYRTWPGFITQPLPTLAGRAEVPSTVEVYVDGVMRMTEDVSPGPFEILDLPMFGQGGEVSLVLRDLLGREQVMTLPFFSSASLLRRGLSDFSAEAGWERRHFGSRSFDYGQALAAGTYRHGYSDRFTAEGRVEAKADQQAVGLGGSAVFPWGVIATAAGALSRSDDGNGHLWVLGLEPGAPRRLSLRVRAQWASEHFAQLGQDPDRLPTRLTLSAGLALRLWDRASLNLTQVRQDLREEQDVVIHSIGFTQALPRVGAVSLQGFETLASQRSVGFGLTFSTTFGRHHSSSTSYRSQRDAGVRAEETSLQIQRSPGTGVGWGYDARIGAVYNASGELTRIALGGAYNASRVGYRFEAGQVQDVENLRLGASGALGAVDGEIFAARRIYDSFGVVRLPDLAGVGVYVNNQLAAVTDAQGDAVLPRLLAYADNQVSIRPEDLPLDAEVDRSRISLAPRARTGVVAQFPVRRVRDALLVLLTPEGSPMPLGAQVRMASSAEGSQVVAERGEVYLRDVAPSGNSIDVSWNGRTCGLRFDLPPGEPGLSPIGPMRCEAPAP